MPCAVQKKFQFFYNFVYHNYKFSSEKLIKKFLIKNKVSSITYESSTRPCVKIFYYASRKMKIPMVHISTGLDFAFVKPQINNKTVNHCDYFVVANHIREKDTQEINFSIKCLGSARYSLPWLKKLNQLIFTKNIKKNESKIKIGIFTKEDGAEGEEVKRLVKKIQTLESFEIEIRNKPRDIRPFKCSGSSLDKFSTTELIDWADIIISSRPSSVLAECIIKNKFIILPEYINKEINKSLINEYDFIKVVKSEYELINLLLKKPKDYLIKNNENFLNKFLVDFKKEEQVSQNYKNFYQLINS